MFALAPIILAVLTVSTAWTDDEVQTVTLLTTPWEGPVETEDAAIIVLTDWAISATVERDSALYRSPLSYFDLPSQLPTAVESKSWGQVKHHAIDR